MLARLFCLFVAALALSAIATTTAFAAPTHGTITVHGLKLSQKQLKQVVEAVPIGCVTEVTFIRDRRLGLTWLMLMDTQCGKTPYRDTRVVRIPVKDMITALAQVSADERRLAVALFLKDGQ